MGPEGPGYQLPNGGYVDGYGHYHEKTPEYAKQTKEITLVESIVSHYPSGEPKFEDPQTVRVIKNLLRYNNDLITLGYIEYLESK